MLNFFSKLPRILQQMIQNTGTIALRKLYQNTIFLYPAFSHTRAEPKNFQECQEVKVIRQ